MKNNYLRGFLGALIGGIICTIPWILMYVYLNFMLSLLGAVIGFGAFFGYKFFGGKVTKKTAIIIAVASVISITVATFVIIPLLLIAKEGLGLSWYYFNYLYTNGDFVTGIIMDYVISLVFTFLGISGVIANINKEGALNDSKESNDTTFVDIDKLTYDEQVKYLESVYAKYGAFSKKTAVSEFKIMSELNIANKLAFMMKMEKAGIVVAPGIKSYFDKEAVTNPERAKQNRKRAILIPVLIVVPIAIVIGGSIGVGIGVGIASLDSSSSSNTEITEKIKDATYTYEKINITLPETFKEIPSEGTDTHIAYLNHGDGNIYQVAFQQESYPEGTDKKSLRYMYVENLKKSFTLIEQKDITIDGVEGIVLDFKNETKYGSEIFRSYVATTDTELVIVMFYTNLVDEKTELSKEAKIKDFKDEVIKYAETIKIKKN